MNMNVYPESNEKCIKCQKQIAIKQNKVTCNLFNKRLHVKCISLSIAQSIMLKGGTKL